MSEIRSRVVQKSSRTIDMGGKSRLLSKKSILESSESDLLQNINGKASSKAGVGFESSRPNLVSRLSKKYT